MPTVNKQNARPSVAKPTPSANGAQSAWGLLDDHVKLSLYGRSGTGKTTLWGTAPKPIKALICSGGLTPGELRSIDTPENRRTITPVIVESTDQFLREVEAGGDYGTWVLDHASGLQDLKLKEILNIPEIPVQKGWGLATLAQYGQCALEWKEMIRRLINLPANVVIVAHERVFGVSDEGGNEVVSPVVGSGLMEKTTNWLNGACDYVCQTFIRQKRETRTVNVNGEKVSQVVDVPGAVEYCLRTGPSPTYYTKFRRPRDDRPLPELIVDPSWSKLLKLIRGK